MSAIAATDALLITGRLLDFTDIATDGDAGAHVRYVEAGAILVQGGRIVSAGERTAIEAQARAGVPVHDYGDHLILPGFIDTHLHYPQTQVIASYGAQLLEWLERFTFVEEQRFADPAHCVRIADFFLDELLRNGTTTAAVYCTIHPGSVDALFEAAQARGMAMIAGKVMMDRGAPSGLLDSAERGFTDSKALIARWHGKDRLNYAVTPRFALTSSEAQLDAAGQLLIEHGDVYLQTHLAENTDEIAAVRKLFPKAQSYTDVYDRHGLLGPRSIFGHCIHLGEDECHRLHESDSVAAFCPTSNLFIGSGLMDLARLQHKARPIRVSLATDIGGGTSYSMLRTAAEAYKVLQLQGQNLPGLEALCMMTLGNAKALGLENEIGSLNPGCYADLVVIDSAATPAMAHRRERIADLADEVFLLTTLGDDRCTVATYVAGERRFEREAASG